MKINYTVLAQLAGQVANTSDVRTAKVGAVIFTKTGRVVTSASNRRVLGNSRKFTIHAEEFALAKAHKIQAKNRMGKLTMVVVRVKRNEPGWFLAKPCPRCEFLLRSASVDAYYSDRNGELKRLLATSTA